MDTLKHRMIEGGRFRGGSGDKMWRMGFGREIVVAGFPPLISKMNKKIKEKICKLKKKYDVHLIFYDTMINQDVNKK